ncbi:MAG TPA: acetyl-CoA hydrolase/transferase C-terminal domain-containing protein, partial [Steroidobacteraceae bacterium]|nr:acetyl-CoA hydrolase/transferase C-terminal domain-containing protein [Steroidobacteraceae bacterium]
TRSGRTTSNILWSYGHETIPRHLRDIVVTEYGIADLRGRTDEEVIAALLDVADSRFQDELLARARAAGKIRGDYRVPDRYRDNLPQRLERGLGGARGAGFFSEYPFGTDLTAEEIALARALRYLEAHSAGGAARLRSLAAALAAGARSARHEASLRRMGLEHPRGVREYLEQRLLAWALDETAAEKP